MTYRHYRAWTTFFFSSYQSQSNLQFVAVDCWPAMSGIAFMLINVRVGLGWAQRSISSSPIEPSQHVTSVVRNRAHSLSGDDYPLRPLAINIQRAVDTDQKYDYPNKTYQASA
jgi:hypothetical protein